MPTTIPCPSDADFAALTARVAKLENAVFPPVGPTPPPEAVAAGLKTLAFSDDFTTDSIASGVWSTNRPFGYPPYTAGYNIANSILTLNGDSVGPNYSISLCDSAAQKASFVASVKGCAEARMKAVNPANYTSVNNGWMSFWALPFTTVTVGTPEGNVEWDIIELINTLQGGKDGATFNGLHEFRPGGVEYSNSNGETAKPPTNPYDGNWHRFSSVWLPGEIQWFIDGALTCTVKYSSAGAPTPADGHPPGTYSMMDSQNMVLILGTGAGCPMEVDWVNYWTP